MPTSVPTPPHLTRRLAAWHSSLTPRLAGSGPSPQRLLLIEDSLHYQSLVCMLARQHRPDLEVHVAGNGTIGMALFGALNPDLLLLDMVLPNGEGITLLRHLRVHPAFRLTPVLVLTSGASGWWPDASGAPQVLRVIDKASLAQALPAALDAALGAAPGAPR